MRVVTRVELLELRKLYGEQVFAEVDMSPQDMEPIEEPADEWLILKSVTPKSFDYSVLSPYAISTRQHIDIQDSINALMKEGEEIPLDFDYVIQDTQEQFDTTRFVVMDDDEIRAMIAKLESVLESRPVKSDEPEIRRAPGSLHGNDPSSEWMKWYRDKTGCTLRESRLEGVRIMRLKGYLK